MAHQKYKDMVRNYSNEVRKARAHMKFNLTRDMKTNKKGFYRYTSRIKKTREHEDLLLYGARNLVRGTWKQTRYSVPSLTHFFLVGLPFRKLRP